MDDDGCLFCFVLLARGGNIGNSTRTPHGLSAERMARTCSARTRGDSEITTDIETVYTGETLHADNKDPRCNGVEVRLFQLLLFYMVGNMEYMRLIESFLCFASCLKRRLFCIISPLLN